MKNLFTTTALVAALGLPVIGMAQTATPTETAPMTATATEMPAMKGFLASLGLTDLLATDLIGQKVYARKTAAEMAAPGTAMISMTAADIAAMDSVGEINDLVLSTDGKLQALVIGIGGFIGVGEQDVAVTMDQVSFASDAANPDNMYIIANTTGEMMKTSPAFDRTAKMEDTTKATPGKTATGDLSERAMLTAPAMERDGYARVAVSDISVDLLIGKSVYDANDKNVGTVDDVTVDDTGAVQDVIIDFGGFLGMGTTQVALTFDELTILTNDGNADIRAYVDATKEQVQAMPAYVATN